MLSDILDSSTLTRKTVGPSKNLEIHSQVADFMSLDYKSKMNTSREEQQLKAVEARKSSA
jgi:hypothetical protein